MQKAFIPLILFVMSSTPVSAQDAMPKKDNVASPSAQAKSQSDTRSPVAANGCVAECQAFEKRCKSPQNTARALDRDKRMGRPFGALGALGILIGLKGLCTRHANECIAGCTKAGKATITIGSGNIPLRIPIPAKDAAH